MLIKHQKAANSTGTTTYKSLHCKPLIYLNTVKRKARRIGAYDFAIYTVHFFAFGGNEVKRLSPCFIRVHSVHPESTVSKPLSGKPLKLIPGQNGRSSFSVTVSPASVGFTGGFPSFSSHGGSSACLFLFMKYFTRLYSPSTMRYAAPTRSI